jgi:hypothetical protein
LAVNAEDNWWGDESGPYHPTTNPSGLGDQVSNYVDYDPWSMEPWPTTGVAERGSRARAMQVVLRPNYPNPFNPSTSIAFELPEPAHVSLRVYDASGSLVRTLVDNRLARNTYNVEWNGRGDHARKLASGVYYCRLEAGARSLSRKLVMIKSATSGELCCGIGGLLR